MDYQKKKLLTQSVAYMQAHLTLNSQVLNEMRSSEILTEEEVSTIQKDETSSGKVLELVCLLKRKDNRTYSRFLSLLERLHCDNLLSVLKAKHSVAELSKPDPRTIHFLEHQLSSGTVNTRKIHDLAVNVVLKEIYQDEINSLHERLLRCQRQVGKTSRANSDSGQLGKDREDSGVACEDRASRWSGSKASKEELISMIREKDEAISKKEAEYTKLRKILDDTQNDLQSVLDLNSQYLTIISQLNQMQFLANNATPRVSTDRTQELEKQLEDSNAQVEMLNLELTDITSQLQDLEADMEQMMRREMKYKHMLDLRDDADEREVETRIKEIKEEGTMRRGELDKIRNELNKTQTARNQLQERVATLAREKEKIEFHLRQQELTIKKMKRSQKATSTIQAAEAMLALHNTGVKLPSVDRPPSQLSSSSAKSSRVSQQYCMFCRQEYQPLKNQGCRTHFRPIRSGKWTCCKDDCHRSAGCLQVPHFYIEFSVDKKVFLTDGQRYMEIG